MTGRFSDAPARVRAPATSANLGSGYDSLGLALALHDEVTAGIGPEGLTVDVDGEGVDLARDETHLLVRSMRATFDRLGAQPRGLVISCVNRIPHGRGLGSSAAAIVSGVLLARALVVDGTELLPDDDAFGLAAALEGHPDNVAACCHGGLTVSWTDSADGFHAVRAPVAAPLTPVALIPAHASSTAQVRGLLPATVPHADASFAAARSALLVGLLAGGAAPREALLAATDDRLHQPYRAPAMPETAELVARLRSDGHPAFVSGAGPTVLALAADQVEVEAVRAAAPDGWRVEVLPIDRDGAFGTVTRATAATRTSAPARHAEYPARG